MFNTPVKQKSEKRNICIVCGNISDRVRLIEYKTNTDIGLKELLKKYGGISVESGILCRNCFQKLINLDKKCREFYDLCQKNYVGVYSRGKRVASSPANDTRKRSDRKDTPVKARNRLFQLSFKADENPNDSSSGGSYAVLYEKSFTDIPSAGTAPTTVQYTNTSKSTPAKQFEDQVQSTCCKNEDESSFNLHIFKEIHSYAKSPLQTKKKSSDQCRKKSLNLDLQSNAQIHSYAKPQSTGKTAAKKTTRSKNKAQKYNSICSDISSLMKSYSPLHQEKLQEKDREILLRSCLYETTDNLVSKILSIEYLRKNVVHHLSQEISETAKHMNRRKHFYVSKLMEKNFEDLKNINWFSIVEELLTFFPDLFVCLLSILLEPHQMSSYMQIERVVPRLGMVYGVLMQGRNKELSLVQRMMSLLLFDNICDQKVFDRLQPVGVCIGYERSLKVIENFGGKYKEQLIEEIQNNKTIRIVGDNINWTVGVHDQRQDNRGHMQHAFGSAAIVQNISFDHLSNIYPQRDFCSTPVQAFLPSPEDNEVLTRDYTIISARVMLKHLPYFRQFRDIVPTYISQPTYPELQQKSKVIPLPVLYKNEQSYKDVVDILEFYEDLVLDVCRKCNKDENDFFIHVGGDQLTRERFSGAKAMRAHEDERKDRFENISPITFELFHMQMNFLKMAFKILYKENSVGDRGTLSHLKNIISRTNVNENINTHYDEDKDFFVSVVDMYIVECVLEYFGMPDVNSAPSKHIPPEFADDEIKRCWFFNEVGTMLKNEIKTMNMGEQEVEVEGEVQMIHIKLANGKETKISVLKRKTPENTKVDKVQNYSRRVLELGLVFKDWLDFCKMPNRDRGLCLLRNTMLIFKSNNNLSKYAYEIMRLLVHQTCILSEKAANEEFYGLFVNTSGQVNGHIPADRRMEYLVKQIKEHIKHMFSNKTERNVRNRSSAISSIREIAEHYDEISGVVERSKRHSDKSAVGDELSILNELREVRPFSFEEGRQHEQFSDIQASSSTNINVTNYHRWIENKKLQFSVEYGN